MAKPTKAAPPVAPVDSKVVVSKADKDRQLKILARSVCKELRGQGYQPREIINLATEILTQVTADIIAADASADLSDDS